MGYKQIIRNSEKRRQREDATFAKKERGATKLASVVIPLIDRGIKKIVEPIKQSRKERGGMSVAAAHKFADTAGLRFDEETNRYIGSYGEGEDLQYYAIGGDIISQMKGVEDRKGWIQENLIKDGSLNVGNYGQYNFGADSSDNPFSIQMGIGLRPTSLTPMSKENITKGILDDSGAFTKRRLVIGEKGYLKDMFSRTKSFADGGTYITDGPELIMVGDNESGKEIVNVKPIDDADLGRYGDTEMREVDGIMSHVNPWEAYQIDTKGEMGEEIVKDSGSGTINPNTGKPEYYNPFQGSNPGPFAMPGGSGVGFNPTNFLGGGGASSGLGFNPVTFGVSLLVDGAMAGKAAKKVRGQIKDLKQDITQVVDEQSDMAEDVKYEFDVLETAAADTFSNFQDSYSSKLDELNSGIANMQKKAGGLKTGTIDTFESETLNDMADASNKTVNQIQSQNKNARMKLGQQYKKANLEISNALQGMHDTLADLKEKDHWSDHFLGGIFG